MSDPVTFYTVSDASYFPGTIALLNSLRLTHNDGDLVVLDRGLTATQRKRLEAHATVVELPIQTPASPHVYKAFPHLLSMNGIVVVIDSDMIVTGSLDAATSSAAEGRICVFPDAPWGRNRWFAEWHEALDLRAPLRRQEYVNTGFVAVSAARWSWLLARWWEVCERIPPEQVLSSADQPFWTADQDAFNALLASEVPQEAIEILPEHAAAYPEEQVRLEVDTRTLRSTLDGEPVTILHHVLVPKVWQPRGWLRLRRDAYVRLLPRLLFADDVPLRLDWDEVPFWLRPTQRARSAARILDLAHGGIRSAVYATPAPLRRQLIRFRHRFFSWVTR